MVDNFPPKPERRQSVRLSVTHRSQLRLALDCTGAHGDAVTNATLTDISCDGLMAADAGQLVPGALITLEVPLVGWREAEVMWIAGNRAGCRFVAPLGFEELRMATAGSERLAEAFPGLARHIESLAKADSPVSLPGPAGPRRPASRAPRITAVGGLLLLLALMAIGFIVG